MPGFFAQETNTHETRVRKKPKKLRHDITIKRRIFCSVTSDKMHGFIERTWCLSRQIFAAHYLSPLLFGYLMCSISTCERQVGLPRFAVGRMLTGPPTCRCWLVIHAGSTIPLPRPPEGGLPPSPGYPPPLLSTPRIEGPLSLPLLERRSNFTSIRFSNPP